MPNICNHLNWRVTDGLMFGVVECTDCHAMIPISDAINNSSEYLYMLIDQAERLNEGLQQREEQLARLCEQILIKLENKK